MLKAIRRFFNRVYPLEYRDAASAAAERTFRQTLQAGFRVGTIGGSGGVVITSINDVQAVAQFIADNGAVVVLGYVGLTLVLALFAAWNAFADNSQRGPDVRYARALGVKLSKKAPPA